MSEVRDADAAARSRALLIVGCGLIGSSLARAARRRGLAERILVLDHDPAVVEEAVRLGLADAASTSAAELGPHADLVALCTPPLALAAVGSALLDHTPSDAVLFDVGSVKGPVRAALAPACRRAGRDFVPAHPIAGTERSGPAAGLADLFDGRWCILTPGEGPHAPSAASVERVAGFWRGCGAHVATMSPEAHDALLAATSHTPHLIAYALTLTAADADGAVREDVARYSAGGFRDFTRIAASDPTMWRDVFLANREAVLSALDAFEARLAGLRAAVAASDGDALMAAFTATRGVRARIVAMGQETDAPDFGRPHGES